MLLLLICVLAGTQAAPERPARGGASRAAGGARPSQADCTDALGMHWEACRIEINQHVALGLRACSMRLIEHVALGLISLRSRLIRSRLRRSSLRSRLIRSRLRRSGLIM